MEGCWEQTLQAFNHCNPFPRQRRPCRERRRGAIHAGEVAETLLLEGGALLDLSHISSKPVLSIHSHSAGKLVAIDFDFRFDFIIGWMCDSIKSLKSPIAITSSPINLESISIRFDQTESINQGGTFSIVLHQLAAYFGHQCNRISIDWIMRLYGGNRCKR